MPRFGTFASSAPPVRLESLAVGHVTTPFISAYIWSSGFSTKYSDPTSLPASNGKVTYFSKSNNYVGTVTTSANYISIYRWLDKFETKYSDPATLPSGNLNGFSFSPDENAVIAIGSVTPFVQAWVWSSAGFGTKYSNPATIPTAAGSSRMTIDPSGAYAAFGTGNSPFIYVYPWSSSGFGTKYADPASIHSSPGTALGVKFNPDSTVLAVGFNTSVAGVSVIAYPWSSSGFGTKYTDPTTSSNGTTTYDIDFDKTGSYIVTTFSNTPYIHAWNWSSGFGTKIADPSTLATGNAIGVAFNKNSDVVALAHSNIPYISAWAFTSSFGTKYSNPSISVGNGQGIDFTN